MSDAVQQAVEVFIDHSGGRDSGAWKVAKLAGDASNRSYFRVSREDISFMVMKLADESFASEEGPPSAPVSDEIGPRSAPGDFERLPFVDVAEYLAKGNIGVPEVYFQDMERGFLVLEDLGDLTLERALAAGRDRGDLYRWAIDVLVDIQAYAREFPDNSCIAFGRSFGRDLLSWEFEHFYDWGLVEYTGQVPDDGDALVLRDFFEDVVKRLTAVRRGFIHRDYQSRNLMIHQGRLRVIDFQDALTGPYIYDLVALLRDSYVRFQPSEIEGYLEYYLEAGRSLIPWLPEKDELTSIFQLQALQRKLKDAGRFVYIDRVKGNPKFLPNIGQSLSYVNEAFDALPEYEPARKVLAKYLPEHFSR